MGKTFLFRFPRWLRVPQMRECGRFSRENRGKTVIFHTIAE
ncbi:MAG: hypothetical protein PHS73_04415 [Candidatus Peribacteraceae bacterium]|nr:hypothetical protein [Candidatus Peribacteraceae bacterium]